MNEKGNINLSQFVLHTKKYHTTLSLKKKCDPACRQSNVLPARFISRSEIELIDVKMKNLTQQYATSVRHHIK